MSFSIKQNDTQPTLEATLSEPDGTKTNLTGSTVTFVMAQRGQIVINRQATIQDAANGLVWFTFETTDTANAGQYQAEFHVTFADGSTETYPNVGFLTVNIMPSLT